MSIQPVFTVSKKFSIDKKNFTVVNQHVVSQIIMKEARWALENLKHWEFVPPSPTDRYSDDPTVRTQALDAAAEAYNKAKVKHEKLTPTKSPSLSFVKAETGPNTRSKARASAAAAGSDGSAEPDNQTSVDLLDLKYANNTSKTAHSELVDQ